jgi:hypothetical protein
VHQLVNKKNFDNIGMYVKKKIILYSVRIKTYAQYSFVFAVCISNMFQPDLLAIFWESHAVMFQLRIISVVTTVVHITP